MLAGLVFLLAGGIFLMQKNKSKAMPDEYGLVIYCPHPADFISTLVKEFETETGISVKVVNESSGCLLEKLEEEKEAPVCDLLWGGSLLTVRPKEYLFDAYHSVNEDSLQEEFKNKEGNMTRFTDVPSVIMVNTDLVGDIKIEGYSDLLNPALKGKIACCDPSGSSSAFEHLTNMLYAMGEGRPEEGWPYVEALCRNIDGKLLSGSAEVYQGVAAGDYIAGLTFEEGAARYMAENAHVRIVYMKEGVVSTPDGLYIIKNARHKEAAEAFIDFATGYNAQRMIAAHLNRRSVRSDVPAPAYLPDKEEIPMIYADADEVVSHKEAWLAHFEDIMDTLYGKKEQEEKP